MKYSNSISEKAIVRKEKIVEAQELRIANDLLKLKLLHNELRQLIRTQHLSIIKELQGKK